MDLGIVIAYFIWSVSAGVITLLNVLDNDVDAMYFTPRHIYRTTKMNMLSCIVCSALFIVLSPIWNVSAIVIWLIYKITHVGRKIENKR